jgi:hypothetical protein
LGAQRTTPRSKHHMRPQVNQYAGRKAAELPARSGITPRYLLSRKQPFLLFYAHASLDSFQHKAGGDLGEFFGLDFVEASAVDAAFRNQIAGLNPF